MPDRVSVGSPGGAGGNEIEAILRSVYTDEEGTVSSRQHVNDAIRECLQILARRSPQGEDPDGGFDSAAGETHSWPQGEDHEARRRSCNWPECGGDPCETCPYLWRDWKRAAERAEAASVPSPVSGTERCETCGMHYDEDSAGAECSRLEADILMIHDALAGPDEPSAINAAWIIERIEALKAPVSGTEPDTAKLVEALTQIATGRYRGASYIAREALEGR